MARSATLERQTGRLPAELTSFIGRTTELDQVRGLLAGHRLVTLTGPGGVGKTRLAVRAANLVRDAFDDGVHFVNLSGLTEPLLLAQTISDAFGLGERGADPAARLADHLADRRVLLVLDTCEHLVEECAVLTESLLAGAPELRVLATSRQPLAVMGECTFTVAPLGRPGSDGPDCDSVRLFAERAAATVQGWTLTGSDHDAVVRLCDRLDGIPLAIELAAVQLRALSLDQVADRIGTHLFQARGRRTRLQRHQTLRATIGWSHELCSPEERLLWARLSVFATDFDLDAAEQVCGGDGLPAGRVVEGLTGLVEKSIVQRADRDGLVRYRMLDTLREYGADRLAAQGEDAAARLRHRCFDRYAALLRRARAELAGPRQAHWLGWYARERANIRGVLGHVLPSAATGTAREAMTALAWFWALTGVIGEGRHWTDRLLEVRDTTEPGWSPLLTMAALNMTIQNDVAAARELVDRASAQAGEEGDEAGIVQSLGARGVLAMFEGDFDRSRRLLGDAVATYHDSTVDDPMLMLLMELFRGLACLFQYDFPAAIAHADRVTRDGEELGELWASSYGVLVGGLALWLDGRNDDALRRLRSSLRTKRDLDDGLGMALGLEAIAGCLGGGGEFVRAARLLGTADRMREYTQTSWFGPHHELLWQLNVDAAVRALGPERYRAAFDEGARRSVADAVADALGESAPASAGRAGGVLTERELQVAALVAEGLSNREIAERLTIAKRTADSHVEHILGKLGFSSRAQIAVWTATRSQDRPAP